MPVTGDQQGRWQLSDGALSLSDAPAENRALRSLERRMLRIGAVRRVFLLFCALGAGSCGARTGLYTSTDRSFGSGVDASLIGGADAQGLEMGVSTSCLASIAIETGMSIEAGTGCMAGPEILECDVASTGDHMYPNYCVTSALNCTAADDPTCQSQCSAGEFGVLCGELTVPGVPGCRVLWPSSDPGPSGLVFCCACG
jgi:hypothetical protein